MMAESLTLAAISVLMMVYIIAVDRKDAIVLNGSVMVTYLVFASLADINSIIHLEKLKSEMTESS